MQTLAELIPESEVYERFPGLFREDELMRARKSGAIGFYPRGRSAYYTEADLVEYLRAQRVAPCPANQPLDPARDVPRDSSKSADTGSAASVTPIRSPITGMTRQLEERAASQLEKQT